MCFGCSKRYGGFHARKPPDWPLAGGGGQAGDIAVKEGQRRALGMGGWGDGSRDGALGMGGQQCQRTWAGGGLICVRAASAVSGRRKGCFGGTITGDTGLACVRASQQAVAVRCTSPSRRAAGRVLCGLARPPKPSGSGTAKRRALGQASGPRRAPLLPCCCSIIVPPPRPPSSASRQDRAPKRCRLIHLQRSLGRLARMLQDA